MAASSTDAGPLSLGLGLGRRGDKPRGSAACPRAVPAETRPRSDLPPTRTVKAQPGPSAASAPRQGPLPGNLLCWGSPGPRSPCGPPAGPPVLCASPSGLQVWMPPAATRQVLRTLGGAVGPGSPRACPGQPCPPTTPRCHPLQSRNLHHQLLGPPGAVVMPAVTRAAGQETPGVVGFRGGSRDMYQLLSAADAGPTRATPDLQHACRPSPPACLWPSRAHAKRVLPAVFLRPQFLLPWDPGNQPLAGCWVSPHQRSRGQLLEGTAGSCSVSSVPSAVVTAGPSTFSLRLEETGWVSRGPRGSRRGGAGRLGPFPALRDPPCLPCPCGPGAQISHPAPFQKQSKGVNCKRLIPILVLN